MPRLLRSLYERLVLRLNSRSALYENGERIDIDLNARPRYALMDMYQKSHYQRYLFAKRYVRPGMVCGDFACGSGYGSALLAQTAARVTAVDIKPHVIDAVASRYANLHNVEFICHDLRSIVFDKIYDLIVSFETVEHVEEPDVAGLFRNFARALKNGGILIFSTPYLQPRTRAAVEMGFHHVFDIDEAKIRTWLAQAGLFPERFFYQNYESHEVVESLPDKAIVVCVAKRTEDTA